MANAIVTNYHCCQECGQWMKKDHRTIQRHLNEMHKEKGKGMFVCPICIKPFTRFWTLSRHSRTIHNVTHLDLTSTLPVLVTKPTTSKIAQYWPLNYKPRSVIFRVLYGNNSPYPSCLQLAANHPLRTVALNHPSAPSRT